MGRQENSGKGVQLTVSVFVQRVQRTLQFNSLHWKTMERNAHLLSIFSGPGMKTRQGMLLEDAILVRSNECAGLDPTKLCDEVDKFKARWPKFLTAENKRNNTTAHVNEAQDFKDATADDGDIDTSEPEALVLELGDRLSSSGSAVSDSTFYSCEDFEAMVEDTTDEVEGPREREKEAPYGTTDEELEAVEGSGEREKEALHHGSGTTDEELEAVEGSGEREKEALHHGSGQDGRGSRINEGGASPCLKNISVTATAAAQDEKVSSAAKTCGMKEAIDEWTSGEKPVVESGSPVEEACQIFCREINVEAYILGKEAGTEAVGKSMRGDLNVAYGGDLDLTGMGLSEEEESDYKKAFWLGHRAGAGIVLYPGPDIKKAGFMKTLKEAMKLAKTSNDPDLARRHQSIFELAPYLDEHLAKLLEMEVRRMRAEADMELSRAQADFKTAKGSAGVKGKQAKSASARLKEAERNLEASKARALLLDWMKLKPVYEAQGEGLTARRGTLWGQGLRMQTVNVSSGKVWKPAPGEEYDGWRDNAKTWTQQYGTKNAKSVRSAKEECDDAAGRIAAHGCLCQEMESNSNIESRPHAPPQEIHADTRVPAHRRADLELDGRVSDLAADILYNLLHPTTFLLSVGSDNFLQYVVNSHLLMEMDLDSLQEGTSSEEQAIAREKALKILGLNVGATLPVLNLSIPDGWLVAFPGHTLHGGAANGLGMSLWRLHCYASVLEGFINPQLDENGDSVPIAGVLPNATEFPGEQVLMVGGQHLKKLQVERTSSKFLRDFIEDFLLTNVDP